MNQRGVAAVPILIIVALLIIGGAYLMTSNITYQSPAPVTYNQPTGQPSGATSSAGAKSTTPTVVPIKSTCNTAKDVCFETANPTINIQEGFLEDASNWISDQLVLTGQGGKGYEVKIIGFPKEFSVRVPEGNFSDGGKTKVYLRAQKNVAPKGTYTGKITAKSMMTNITTSADLTLSYSDWGPEAIHTDLREISLDCTVKATTGGVNSRELDCDKDDAERMLKFYHFKNDKTIEIRDIPEKTSNNRSIELVYGSTNATTLNKGQDVYALEYNPKGFDMENLNTEPDGTFRGNFSFVNQADQKEILKLPYTLTVHAYKQ